MVRSTSRLVAFWALIFVLFAMPLAALAQDSSIAGLQDTLAQKREALAEVRSALAKPPDGSEETPKALQSLRETVDKARSDLVTLQAAILKQGDVAKADSDKLGPIPKPIDPPESQETTDKRAAAKKRVEQLAGLVADAQDQIKAADQLTNAIIARPFQDVLAIETKSLDDVESSLAAIVGESDQAQFLQDLRAKVDKTRGDLATLLAPVMSLSSDSKGRLAKLPPAPQQSDPPESPDITAARDKESDLGGLLSNIVKSAQLQSTRADDLTNSIIERQRNRITQYLTHRNDSAFSLNFWSNAVRKVPGAISAANYVLASSANTFAAQINSTSIAIFLLTIAIGYVVAQFLRFRITRWRARLPKKKKTSRRYVASLDAMLAIVYAMLGLPTATAVAVLAFRFAKLLPDYVIQEFGWDFVRAAAIGTGLWALARAILAKEHPELRLLPLSDWAVRRISRRMSWLAILLGVSVLLDGFVRSVHADAQLTVARDNITAFLFLIITASLLIRLRSAPPTIVDGRPLPPDEDINALDILRPISWVAVVIMAICLAAGYSALAVTAAVLPLMLISIVAASYLLTILVDSALTDNLVGDVDRRRAIAGAIGISTKNVAFSATLLSGVLRLVILFTALLTLGAPFGFYSADMLPTMQRAYFGFQIGEMTISPSSILAGIFLFVLIWGMTRLIRGWMSNTLLPRTSFDAGLRNSIATIVGYIGVILAVSAALSEVGVSMQNVGYVASALAVGIGFGLQAIVNNFVSGLILLAERPIRVGDIIAAGGEEGYVRRISVRATEIETFDRATLIIPNSTLITGSVKNWVYGNTSSRLRIALTFAYDSDIDAVKAAMLGAAEDDPRILPSPPPRVYLGKMDAGLEFELVVMIASMETQPAVKSDVLTRMLKTFRAKGIRLLAQGAAVAAPVVVHFDDTLQSALAAKLLDSKPEAPAALREPVPASPPAASPPVGP